MNKSEELDKVLRFIRDRANKKAKLAIVRFFNNLKDDEVYKSILTSNVKVKLGDQETDLRSFFWHIFSFSGDSKELTAHNVMLANLFPVYFEEELKTIEMIIDNNGE